MGGKDLGEEFNIVVHLAKLATGEEDVQGRSGMEAFLEVFLDKQLRR